MRKSARITTKLQPHQQKALEKALKENLILAHSTGSGKTLTAIAIADALNRPTTVLTPASLVENFNKELKKHKKDGPPVEVYSLPTAVSRNYQIPYGNTLIIDEAHALRNSDTSRAKYIRDQIHGAGRVFALTGTPAYNNITDIAPLVNMVSKQNVLPVDKGAFNQRYVKDIVVNPSFWGYLQGVKPGVRHELQNTDELGPILRKYVDAFDIDIEKPRRIDETIRVPFTPTQQALYSYVEGQCPISLRYKIRNNLPPSKSEASNLNSFLSGVRQVSNTPGGYMSDKTTNNAFLSGTRQISNTPAGYSTNAEQGAKILRSADILQDMYKKNPKMRAFVYSNYIDSGVGALGSELDKRKIPYALFTGSLSQKEKKDIVDRYNAGKLPIILGTGSASEGLDLKRTNLIQLMEPHFNNARLNQVIGRGIRYKSHEGLPEDQRKVLVQHFEGVRQNNPWLSWVLGYKPKQEMAVDGYLMNRSAEKDMLEKQVRDLFKEPKKEEKKNV